MAKKTKKSPAKKTTKKAAKKTAKKAAKKTTKKAAKKTTKKAAKKTTKKAVKKTTKKAAKKTTKKAAKKTTKKTTKKAAKKTTKKAAKKTAKGAKSDSKKKGGSATGKTGVTVHLGTGRPALKLAPGVLISHHEETKKAQKEEAAPRKLTKKELRLVRELLIEKRDQLLHGIKRELAEYRERSSSPVPDEADQAAMAYDEDLSFEISSRADEELEEIDTALEKIEKGTYGECENCSCPISPSRLNVLPFATNCTDCRGEKERSKRNDNAPVWAMLGGDDDDND